MFSLYSAAMGRHEEISSPRVKLSFSTQVTKHLFLKENRTENYSVEKRS